MAHLSILNKNAQNEFLDTLKLWDGSKKEFRDKMTLTMIILKDNELANVEELNYLGQFLEVHKLTNEHILKRLKIKSSNKVFENDYQTFYNSKRVDEILKGNEFNDTEFVNQFPSPIDKKRVASALSAIENKYAKNYPKDKIQKEFLERFNSCR